MGLPEKMENGDTKPLADRQKPVIIKNDKSINGDPSHSDSTSVIPEILACVSGNSFHLALGLSLAYSAILLPQLEKDGSEIPVSSTKHSPWIASAAPLAVVSGSLITGPVMNYMGRINTVRAATIPYCIGWAVIATATGVPALIVGRFVTGLAAGTIGTNPAIVYTTEVVRPKWRGAVISTAPFLVSLGTMFVYILGAFLPWRTVAWVCFAAPVIPLASTLMWSPESPMWLAERGKRKTLEKALKFLARRDENSNWTEKADIMIKAAERRKAVMQSKQHSNCCSNFLKIAGQRTVRRPLLLLTALFLVQQFSGIYVVQFYAVTMFKEIGSAVDPSYASVIVGGLRAILSVLAIALLRWFPRRPLIIVSALGMILTMAVAGYYADMSDGGKIELQPPHGALATTSLLAYVTFSMIGLLTIPWTMTAELFPQEARSTAQGTVIAIANLFMFASVQTYRPLEVLLGSVARVLWLYSGVSALSIIVVFLFLPETHGRPLGDIEKYFRTSVFYPGYERWRRRFGSNDVKEEVDLSRLNGKESVNRYMAVPTLDDGSSPVKIAKTVS